MSLINNARKRAQESPPGPSPIDCSSNATPESGRAGWILVGLIAVAAIVFGYAFVHRTETMPRRSIDATLAGMTSNPPAGAPPEAPVAAAVIPVARATPPATNVSLAVSNAGPMYKVQGIVFSPARPWAIINKQTVFVGDRVNGARVTVITRNSVTLQMTDGSVTNLIVGK
ncbi:MAG TPA: hypothetical protein VFV81_04710 [Verrucomicrobiae bacterium]|nr:hypothetical protein [Verrucomicrobiae bacterium]